MSLEVIYYNFLILWTAIALVVFITLFYKNASYGRFIGKNSSFTLPSRVGWVIMESPTVIVILIFLIIFFKNVGANKLLKGTPSISTGTHIFFFRSLH